MEWRERALCAQTDPEAFFPEKGGSVREAKKVCRRCPVRAECLADAVAHREQWGIWGGLTIRERRPLYPELPAPVTARRNQGSQGCGTAAGYQRHWRDGEPSCDACREAASRARNALKEAS